MMVTMTSLSLIGYWRTEGDWASDYPDPREWVDPEWDEDERHATWFYFASGTLFRTFMGFSLRRICGQNNGAVEYTDGTYVWPEGLAHYIYDHAVRLPDELVAHARRRLGAVEGREVVSEWWVGATAKK
jgi:hypothetical protein